MAKNDRSILQVSQHIEAPGIVVGTREFHTLTCCHCNRVVVLNPERKRERHHCFKCSAYVCDSKVCIEECNPFLQSVELAIKHEGSQPFLLRGPNGEVLFDTALRDNERIF